MSYLLQTFAYLLLGHVLLQSILVLLFGLSFSYFNPFNGSIYGINYSIRLGSKERKVPIHIQSLRFTFSIFGFWSHYKSSFSLDGNHNSSLRKYVSCIIEGIHIDISHLKIASKEPAGMGTQPNSEKESEKYSNYNDNFNIDEPVYIYPDSKIGRWFLSWILVSCPRVFVRISNVFLECPNGFVLHLNKLRAQTDIQYFFKRETIHKVEARENSKFSYWFNNVELGAITLKNSKGSLLGTFFEMATLSIGFMINLKEGVVKSAKPDFRMKGTDLSFIFLFGLINAFLPGEGYNSHQEINKNKYDISKEKLYKAGWIYKVLNSFTISIQSFKISEAPLISMEKLEKISRVKNPSYENIIFCSTTIEHFTFCMEKLNPNNVGYNLKFVNNSFPVSWSLSLNSVSCSLDYTFIENYTGKHKIFQIVSLPNIIINLESTLLINLLRSVFNKEEEFKKRQTIMDAQYSISRLTVDISAEQLGILISAIKSLNKSKLENSDNKTAEKASCSISTMINNKRKKFTDMILKINPKWSYKMLFEKPTFILKSENEYLSNGKDMHILFISPSLINAEIYISASSKFVSFASRFDIPNFVINYQRNNVNKNADTIGIIRDINFKNSFHLQDMGDFESMFNISYVDINLTNLSTLNGLKQIIVNTHRHTLEKSSSQIIQSNKSKNGINEEPLNQIFYFLPDWFKKVKIELSDVTIKLGSKSIFMNSSILLDEDKYDPIFDSLNKTVIPSSLTLSMQKLEFNLINEKKFDLIFDDNTSSSASDKTKSVDDYFWMAEILISKIKIATLTKKSNLVIEKENVLKLPIFVSKIYANKNSKLEFSNNIDTLAISYSLTSHFNIFSAIYLLRKTIFLKLANVKSFDKNKKLNIQSKKCFLDNFCIRAYLKEAQIKLKLANNFQARLDLFGIKAIALKNPLFIFSNLVRLSVKKESTANYYHRILTFEKFKSHIKVFQNGNPLKMLFDNSNIKINVPSNFIVHTLFDSIKLTVKLTKRFLFILKTGNPNSNPPITEMKKFTLPTMKLKSKDLSFVCEDDPFEAKLGMIYQLGLMEQNSRLKKLDEFKKYVDKFKKELSQDKNDTAEALDSIYYEANSHSDDLIVNEWKKKLYKLRINFAKSWKILVNEFETKRKEVLNTNNEILTDNLSYLLHVSPKFNKDLINFNGDPPLMSVILTNVAITASAPTFKNDANDPHKFVHRVGRGIPLDTKWNVFVPLRLKLQSSDVRVHLRDYPLPMVCIVGSDVGSENLDNRKNDTFTLVTDLVITEQMPQSEHELWKKYVPMFIDLKDGIDDEFYACNVETTICSTKMIYEANCFVDTDRVTMVNWSNAFQHVLRHLDVVFDGFSKPTQDPSPKLGVWDKMRNILHGYFKVKWVNQDSEVLLCVPNSNDPYKLLTETAGFSLVFKDNVEWIANDPNRENERDYFIFKSDSIKFGVSNFLSHPLPTWCSNKSIFFALDPDNFLSSSMFGYYLNRDLYYNPENEKHRSTLEISRRNSMKSSNIELTGKIVLKLSMTFERDDGKGGRTSEFKNHWENTLTHSEYVNDKEFDSFEGFRSNYLHMALTLVTEDSSTNTLRLSPRAVRQFVSWFMKFQRSVSPPVRHGPLWNFRANSVKFGKHLMTFKFLFLVEPLYIVHGYRVDLINPKNNAMVGIKAKIGKFMCDLHERKEAKVKHVEFLDKKYNVLSLNFYLGSVELHDIDLRAFSLFFEPLAEGDSNPSYKFEIFDKDNSWINFNDFDEINMPSIRSYNIEGKILPLLYAKHFKYSMAPEAGKSDFGSEDTHSCAIDMDDFPSSKFNHIFEVNNLKLKWYCDVRDIIFDYITELEFRDAYIYSASYAARSLIKERLKSKNENTLKEIIGTSGLRSEMSENIDNLLDNFDDVIRFISETYDGFVPVNDMLVKFSDIQIQLMPNMNSENVILLHTQENELQIIDINDKDWKKSIKKKSFAKRFGTTMNSADLLVINRNDFKDLSKLCNIQTGYGSIDNWPIFLNDESYAQLTSKNKIFNDICIVFFFEKIGAAFSGKRRNSLFLSIPSFKTTFSSDSYICFMSLIQKLLLYFPPEKRKMNKTTQTFMNSMDVELANDVFDNLQNTVDDLNTLQLVQESLEIKRNVSSKDLDLDIKLRDNMGKLLTDIYLIAKTLLLNTMVSTEHNDDNCSLEWYVQANELQIDFVDQDDHYNKFLTFEINGGKFNRLEINDGSSINEININSIDILNKDTNILFPDLLSRYEPIGGKINMINSCEDMINVKWELGAQVGGLHDVKSAEITCHPLKISIEEDTGIKLMHFLFPDHIFNDEAENEFEEEYDETFVSSSEEEFDEDSIKGVERVPAVAIDGPSIYSSSTDSLNSLDFNDKARNMATSPVTALSNEPTTVPKLKIMKKRSMSKSLTSTVTQSTSGLLNINDKGLPKKLADENSALMNERAEKYFTIGDFKFNSLMLCITLFAKGKMRIINVNDLIITLPTFLVKHKTWSGVEMVTAVKKHAIKTLLKHSGRLLKNKLFVYRKRQRVNRISKKRDNR